MEDKFKIQHNYILDHDNIVHAVWAEKDKILYILKEDRTYMEFVNVNGTDFIISEEIELKTKLKDGVINPKDVDYFEDLAGESSYFKLTDLDFKGTQNSINSYRYIDFCSYNYDVALMPYLVKLIPDLKKAKKAFDKEVQKLENRTCIWKTYWNGFTSSGSYILYLYDEKDGTMTLELANDCGAVGDDGYDEESISNSLFNTNALGELNDSFISDITNKESLLKAISEILYKGQNSRGDINKIEEEAPKLVRRINKFKPALLLSAQEIISAVKDDL